MVQAVALAAPEAAREPRVIVVDDDYAMRLSCRQILSKNREHEVETFEDGASGLEAVLARRPDLVIVDLKMPGISGLDVITRVKEIDPDIVIVVITGYPTIGSAVEAIKAGAFDFLPKPFTPDELRLVVARALGRRRLLLETHQLELERELLRRRFVTFVTHQIKTPVAAIRQYLDVLRRLEGTASAEEKRREWLDRSVRCIDELVHLVDDWLTLSRVESRELTSHRDSVALGMTLRSMLESCEILARAKGITLEIDTPEEDVMITGDVGCVGIVFSNLVENAIKYNAPDGHVWVRLEAVSGEAVVSVVDTGIGISEADQPFVFDEFFRVRREADRPRGTGLGLTLTRRIVE
ncbi:MAG: response regulator, partial [Candidatus Eisenbacteria bacterium]|nr:response regulator [Candidatus Eisenbacteria bacterium]